MNYNELLESIDNGKLSGFNIIYGDEAFLINKAIKYAKSKFIDDSVSELNYARFEVIENNFQNFIETVSTFPFMSEKKIVVVDDCDFLASTGSLDKNYEEVLLKEINEKSDTLIVLFILRGKKPDSRKKVVKAIKKLNSVYEIKKLDEGELTKYIIEGFKKNTVKISSSNADYLATNCGYLDYDSEIDLYDVNNEISKISSFCCKKGEASYDDIDMLMIKSLDSNIFKLIDLICEKKKKDAQLMLNDMLKNGVAEPFIIHMIARQVRMIYQYKMLTLKGYNSSVIADNMKIRPFIAKKLANISNGLDMNKIEKLLYILKNIDKSIKTGSIDKTVGLEIICSSF